MVKRFLGVGKVQVGLAIMLFFILVAILGQPSAPMCCIPALTRSTT